ncbi:uncharacterized protein TRIADDRAFT_681, partial [Trichoplax adhaerens]
GMESSLRLQDGTSPYDGRLEIFHNRQWGGVCDDNFSMVEANVACNQLGYGKALSYFCCSNVITKSQRRYRQINFYGVYWLDNVKCSSKVKKLSDCHHAGWGMNNCGVTEAVSIQCEEFENSLRLVSGPDKYSGRLQIYHKKVWGAICDDKFSLIAASVACRQLGYDGASSFKCCSYMYGADGWHLNNFGFYWLDDLDCIGNETELASCNHASWGQTNCRYNEAVSIKCYVNGALRLINDNSTQTTSGIVQIYQNGTWGTVCSRYSFSRSAANILCKQLGYKTAFSYDCCSKYAHITGKIWIGEINCYGNETSINDCPQLSFNSKSCMHQSDVGLHCSEGEVRLIYQRENRTGQLEIFHKSSWHTVCGYRFNMNAANVACRQLGFLKAEKINCCSRDTEHKEVFLNEFVCLGDEKSLLDCKQRYQRMCTYRGDIIMSLTCSNGQSYYGDIRLTYSTFGRVEIYSGGSWNSICIQGFSSGSALVICRQLGFKSYKSYHVSYKSYADATGGILMDSLNCTGHEQTILKCPYNIYTKCNHNQDVAVECTALENALRLVRGSNNRTGRLEIFHNKRWGAICDDGFNDINAHVACKQLGFVSFEWYHCCSVYGIDEFLWMENITCYGNESMLANCSHSPWGSHDCSGYETMSLKC